MPDSHDEFDYLCALEAAGQISTEERDRLHGHLKTCSACRQSLDEYEHCAEALSERSERYATVPVPKGMYTRFRARALDHGIQLPADTPEEASAVPRRVRRFRWISVTPARFAVALLLLFVLLAIPFVLRRNELHKKEQALRSSEADKQALSSRIDALEKEHDAVRSRELQAQADIQRLSDELSRERQASAELEEIRTLMRNQNAHVVRLQGVNQGKASQAFGLALYVPREKLVLFAFNLIDQHSLRSHSVYAWGNTGVNHEPEALGKLNLESKKDNRWALRINNSDILARISLVFVTVESSERNPLTPTGSPVLLMPLNTSNP